MLHGQAGTMRRRRRHLPHTGAGRQLAQQQLHDRSPRDVAGSRSQLPSATPGTHHKN